ncbi:sigma-70 family RNA polymerase sigma factor [Dermatophilaceae bacterium Soc4.6]
MPSPAQPAGALDPGQVLEIDSDADWVPALRSSAPGARREQALAQLHARLVVIARGEVHRRNGTLRLTGPERDDVAQQAADDALLAVLTKLEQFRGESRFTTWAYAFVVREVSTKLARHFWRRPTAAMEPDDWERLPDRLGLGPAEAVEQRDLLAAVRTCVEDDLTHRQRVVFTAIVLAGRPLDEVVLDLDSNRNAIYKTMFDARRKIRAVLVAQGHLGGAADPAGDHPLPMPPTLTPRRP